MKIPLINVFRSLFTFTVNIVLTTTALIITSMACCFDFNSSQDIHPRYHNYCIKKVEEPCGQLFENKWEKIIKYNHQYITQKEAKKRWRAELQKWQSSLKRHNKYEESIVLLEDQLEEEENYQQLYLKETKSKKVEAQKLEKELNLVEVHPQLVGGVLTPDTSRLYKSDLDKLLGLKSDNELVVYLGKKMTREDARSEWWYETEFLKRISEKCNHMSLPYELKIKELELDAVKEIAGEKISALSYALLCKNKKDTLDKALKEERKLQQKQQQMEWDSLKWKSVTTTYSGSYNQSVSNKTKKQEEQEEQERHKRSGTVWARDQERKAQQQEQDKRDRERSEKIKADEARSRYYYQKHRTWG